MDINNTLAERQSTHGNFRDHAIFAQALKEHFRDACWDKLAPQQREAIDMICHKLARIAVGDPSHTDHWHDIAGYATLVEQELSNG